MLEEPNRIQHMRKIRGYLEVPDIKGASDALLEYGQQYAAYALAIVEKGEADER